jgi:pantothenate kinase-related protein Tda10
MTLELSDAQAEVLSKALRLVTVGSWDPRGLPLPGTHDHAILEGILDQLQQGR